LAAALALHGLEVMEHRRGDYSVDIAMVHALALLTGPDRPDAVVCGNDAMEIWAIGRMAGKSGAAETIRPDPVFRLRSTL
jgi:DNA-binding LacI/PurR family transcriptional regulator